MNDETKRKVATKIYNGAITTKKELISLKIPALIGVGLMILCFIFSYICYENEMYNQGETWLQIFPFAFLLPFVVVYIIRLKNWVMKWKEPIK